VSALPIAYNLNGRALSINQCPRSACTSREALIIPRGQSADPSKTGDEASIFIARADAHVGIGADRFTVGRKIEQQLAPDLFLLDDGFEHRRLHRAHDIVLIDAADPLAGGVFPLGRLREPLHALARADTIILTRCRRNQDTAAIERLIARYNAESPVFRSRVVPLGWITAAGETVDTGSARFPKAAAFCGLGDPRAFWQTLDDLGIETIARRAFADHHRYAPAALRELARGAETLLTTEKDAMNLPPGVHDQIAPCRLYWLKIGIQIENESALLARILR